MLTDLGYINLPLLGLSLNAMTPKEKAISLYQSFYPQVQWKMGQEDCKDRAKECSLIAVKEILRVASYADDWLYNHFLEVKQEINKL